MTCHSLNDKERQLSICEKKYKSEEQLHLHIQKNNSDPIEIS